jgi:hypothetical protein
MLGRLASVFAVAVVAAAVAGTSVTAASAHPSMPSSRHGVEHFTLMVTTTTGQASVIATGLFTDGGTINITRFAPGEIRLGRGTIRVTTSVQGAGTYKLNHATCLQTLTGHGTYRLSHGAGRYSGIHGSGKFTTTVRSVVRRTARGICNLQRPVLAFQGIVNLSGTATLRG